MLHALPLTVERVKKQPVLGQKSGVLVERITITGEKLYTSE